MNYKEAFDITVEEGQSVLVTLDRSGDSKVTWSRGNTVETEIAEKAFNQARKNGYMAYRVSADGSKGEILAQFEPSAEKIILAPPLRGGAGAA